MLYNKTIILKDGRSCTLRNGTEKDAADALDVFKRTHEETDNLLTYPEEITHTVSEQEKFLRDKTDSDDEIEIIAEVDGKTIGLGGINRLSSRQKQKHRAEFGISILKEYWGLGIGRALTKACVECAKKAGYDQLELDVVAENGRAAELYRSEGFEEYGRNPRGCRSKYTGWQELILMKMELTEDE